jgi:hypothetical protein
MAKTEAAKKGQNDEEGVVEVEVHQIDHQRPYRPGRASQPRACWMAGSDSYPNPHPSEIVVFEDFFK